MGVLIDTNVLIEAERGRLDWEDRIAPRRDEDFFLSVVSASELLHGVERATASEVRTRRSAFVEALLERIPLLPVDLASARVHARLWAQLSRDGNRIGANDLWIASQAVAHGLVLITSNLREFRRVPGLSAESWTPSEPA